MIDKVPAQEILIFLQEYASFYKNFLNLEIQKYDCIVKNNIELLETYSKQEQAFKLKSRGLEIERDKLLKRSGFESMTFRQLIEHMPEKTKDEANTLFSDLSKTVLDFKEINLRSIYLTELRLHRIQNRLEKCTDQPTGIYHKTPHFSKPKNVISRKV